MCHVKKTENFNSNGEILNLKLKVTKNKKTITRTNVGCSSVVKIIMGLKK
jgi:hypothetical protein